MDCHVFEYESRNDEVVWGWISAFAGMTGLVNEDECAELPLEMVEGGGKTGRVEITPSDKERMAGLAICGE